MVNRLWSMDYSSKHKKTPGSPGVSILKKVFLVEIVSQTKLHEIGREDAHIISERFSNRMIPVHL